MTGFISEGVIPANTCRDVGGSTPWMGEVEPRREQRSRAKHDSRDGGGRECLEHILKGAKAEAEKWCRDAPFRHQSLLSTPIWGKEIQFFILPYQGGI